MWQQNKLLTHPSSILKKITVSGESVFAADYRLNCDSRNKIRRQHVLVLDVHAIPTGAAFLPWIDTIFPGTNDWSDTPGKPSARSTATVGTEIDVAGR